jgi:murein DD-endopeptidase MepM/ murein hydrolase activator NlpD
LTAGVLVLLTSLAVGATTALADSVDLPSAPAVAAQGAAPAPPVAVAAPAAAVVATTAAVPIVLRLGSNGDAVLDLQREMRRRGARIAVDGEFGSATKKAVKRLQKRFRMKRTGIVTPKLLKRLGLPTRAAAAAPAPAVAPTPVPGVSKYLKVFPVQGEYTYFDDYGAARGQGAHQGNDIMADRGTPLVAVDDGVISKMTRTESGLGGIYIWLRRADGVQYYYAHMDSIAEGLEVGSRISVGQVVGGVGNTGDARSAPPHLHFEIRNEWTPINPYTHLQAVDPTARATSRTTG